MCNHQHVVDNNEGYNVCVHCAFVCDPIYKGVPSNDLYYEKDNKYYKSLNYLKDICANGNISSEIAINVCNSFYNRKVITNDREELIYNLYNELISEHRPMLPEEFELMTDVSKSKIWKINKKSNQTNVLPDIYDFVNRFCAELYLNFNLYKKVKKLMRTIHKKLYYLKVHCLISVCIYIIVLSNDMTISKENICNVCCTSLSNFEICYKKVKKYIDF